MIVTGFFSGTVDFDPSPRVSNLTSVGDRDVFVVELSGPPMCGGSMVTVNLDFGQVPTSGPDVILGTSGDDVINGLGGNDVICAGGGNNTTFGGDGDDILLGGPGDDTIDAADGQADQVSGNDGIDSCAFDRDIDTVFQCEIVLP